MDTRAEIARKAWLHGGWIEWTILGLLAELERCMTTTTPETVARARWQRNGPASWILAVARPWTILAYIQSGRFMNTDYRWTAHTCAGYRTGSHMSLYGAQRAVRKALREAESHASTANKAASGENGRGGG